MIIQKFDITQIKSNSKILIIDNGFLEKINLIHQILNQIGNSYDEIHLITHINKHHNINWNIKYIYDTICNFNIEHFMRKSIIEFLTDTKPKCKLVIFFNTINYNSSYIKIK